MQSMIEGGGDAQEKYRVFTISSSETPKFINPLFCFSLFEGQEINFDFCWDSFWPSPCITYDFVSYSSLSITVVHGQPVALWAGVMGLRNLARGLALGWGPFLTEVPATPELGHLQNYLLNELIVNTRHYACMLTG